MDFNKIETTLYRAKNLLIDLENDYNNKTLSERTIKVLDRFMKDQPEGSKDKFKALEAYIYFLKKDIFTFEDMLKMKDFQTKQL